MAICDVCLESIANQTDLIVFCDICDFAVHQTCYGSELLDGVPKGNWFLSYVGLSINLIVIRLYVT